MIMRISAPAIDRLIAMLPVTIRIIERTHGDAYVSARAYTVMYR